MKFYECPIGNGAMAIREDDSWIPCEQCVEITREDYFRAVKRERDDALAEVERDFRRKTECLLP